MVRCRLPLAPSDLVAALCRVCSSLVLVGAVSPTPPSATSPPPPAPALLRDAVRLRNSITSPPLSPPPPGRKSSLLRQTTPTKAHGSRGRCECCLPSSLTVWGLDSSVMGLVDVEVSSELFPQPMASTVSQFGAPTIRDMSPDFNSFLLLISSLIIP